MSKDKANHVNGQQYISPKQLFIQEIDKAIADGTPFAVTTTVANLPKEELTIIPPDNLEIRKAYYTTAYDEDMQLQSNNDIKISKFTSINGVNLKGDNNEILH